MRLFTAVEIDAAAAKAVAGLIQELRARAETQSRAARVTWVPVERVHLTVQFIGNADGAQLARIRDVLETRLSTVDFTMEIEGVGAFPPRGAPRVLWAGVHAPGDALAALAEEVGKRLEAAGVPREQRAYRPHLTLARVREANGLRTAALLAGLERQRYGTSLVKAITLFESRLSPDGPTYVPLARTPLSAGARP